MKTEAREKTPKYPGSRVFATPKMDALSSLPPLASLSFCSPNWLLILPSPYRHMPKLSSGLAIRPSRTQTCYCYLNLF